ncbi:MAG: hypothetical protein RL264_1782 [Bacteroidota bacterium]|jgi:hypothetical protein
MTLYNVTVSIDPSIESDWLSWMRATHIPEVLKTGCFNECRLSRVHGEEEGGSTYSIMYLAPDQATYERYQREFAPLLQKDHTERYQGRFAAFRTTLTVIEQFHP